MQLKLGVVFLFSLVLAQYNSSGIAFTRHDVTPHRNSARQSQGVYGALKHPSPAVGHMCKEKISSSPSSSYTHLGFSEVLSE